MLKAFETSNVILHIMIISVFIGVFFFTYGAYLEKRILQNQLDFLVDDTIGSFKIFIPELSESIKKPLKEYQIKLDPSADIEVSKSNKQIMKKAMYAILVGFIIGIIIIFVLSKKLDTCGTKTFICSSLFLYGTQTPNLCAIITILKGDGNFLLKHHLIFDTYNYLIHLCLYRIILF